MASSQKINLINDFSRFKTVLLLQRPWTNLWKGLFINTNYYYYYYYLKHYCFLEVVKLRQNHRAIDRNVRKECIHAHTLIQLQCQKYLL